MKHSDWMFQVTWLNLTNQRTLLQLQKNLFITSCHWVIWCTSCPSSQRRRGTTCCPSARSPGSHALPTTLGTSGPDRSCRAYGRPQWSLSGQSDWCLDCPRWPGTMSGWCCSAASCWRTAGGKARSPWRWAGSDHWWALARGTGDRSWIRDVPRLATSGADEARSSGCTKSRSKRVDYLKYAKKNFHE